ncbi:hypothetical protein CL633_03140 [bacterium]|nr:hypothetical protein [bacterium]|tara:strand:+ start:5886 stop:6293 length:408 start_codon:yes stop_codon:yes gene_type:complete
MTLEISPNKVKNTKGTTVRFGGGKNGRVQVGGDFINEADVEIDIRANLDVLGNLINSGKFNIKDYVEEENYKIIEKAIKSLNGKPKGYLNLAYQNLKNRKIDKANNNFRKFILYVKEHPEVVIAPVQSLLQLLLK